MCLPPNRWALNTCNIGWWWLIRALYDPIHSLRALGHILNVLRVLETWTGLLHRKRSKQAYHATQNFLYGEIFALPVATTGEEKLVYCPLRKERSLLEEIP